MQVTNNFNFSNIVIEREQKLTLMVRAKAPPSPTAVERKPFNLGLVLDRSGSMGGEKIEYLRTAACQLVDHLTPKDRLSVVIFDDIVETIVQPALVKNKDRIRTAIRRISARSATNLSGGWMEGLRHVTSGISDGAINRVLLLTDGLANRGIIDDQNLCAIARQNREQNVSTTAMGFGADFNENLLSHLADDGGGAFYFIENPDDAPAAFAEELTELLSVVGQNLTLEIRGHHPVQFLSVLNDYPAEPIENGIRIRAGDLFGEELREVMAEFHIPGISKLGPQRVGDVTIMLDRVVEPVEHHRVEFPVEVNIVEPENAQVDPDPEIQVATTFCKVNEIRKRVIALLDNGHYEEARQFVEEEIEKLKSEGLVTDEVNEDLKRLREDLEMYQHRPEYGSKGLAYRMYRSSRSKGDYRKY